MSIAIRNNNKALLVVPQVVRRKAGFKSGQELEFRASGGVITILSKLPAADDEYAPEQRRAIEARLAEGLADIKSGRTYGPFNTADEMISHMKTPIKTKASEKNEKRPR